MIVPLLHGNANGPFLTAWSFQPTIAIGLVIAAAVYGMALTRVRSGKRPAPPAWHALAFYGGLLCVAVALLGPLDTFNDEAFFLHMLQHLVLMQFAAPLILLGRPVQLLLRALPPRRSGPVLKAVLRPSPVRVALTVVTAPLLVTLLFNGNLVFWHIPQFYDAALASDLVHEIEHLAFFGFALLFWWPIIDPVPRHHKLKPVPALAAVFASMVVGMAIGAMLTLAGNIVYPFYETTAKPWGLTAMVDQQIGGLIMWVGSGLLYVGILLFMLARMLGMGDEPQATTPSAPDAERSADSSAPASASPSA